MRMRMRMRRRVSYFAITIKEPMEGKKREGEWLTSLDFPDGVIGSSVIWLRWSSEFGLRGLPGMEGEFGRLKREYIVSTWRPSHIIMRMMALRVWAVWRPDASFFERVVLCRQLWQPKDGSKLRQAVKFELNVVEPAFHSELSRWETPHIWWQPAILWFSRQEELFCMRVSAPLLFGKHGT